MSKRDIAGGFVLVLSILPDRLWHLGWELSRASLGERTLHWIERAVNWIEQAHLPYADHAGTAIRGIAVMAAVWLFWPQIRKRILQPLAGRKYVPIVQAAVRVRNRASNSRRVKEALTFATNDEQTDWIVRAIWFFAPLQLRKPLSDAYSSTTFKEKDQNHYLSVQGGAVTLFNWLDKGPVCSDVAITRSDLRRVIKKLRAEPVARLDNARMLAHKA
jgi:hypothetical protein